MPKRTAIENQIPALYKRNALNLSLFGYIRGARAALHTISVPEAIGMFMEEYGLDDDDINRLSALNTYNRMQKELLNLKRTDDEQ